jgi:DNA-binding Xre family transcriptional regulator
MLQSTSLPHPGGEICLRVRVRMAERGIRSVAELHRRLSEQGVSVSHSQLIRIIDNKAQHLSVPLLNGLMRVLECGVEELFETRQVADLVH